MSENKNQAPPKLHGIHEEEIRRILSKMKHESEEQMAANLSRAISLPYIDLNIFPVDPETLRTLKRDDAQRIGVVCIKRSGKNISLAVDNPAKEDLLEFLKALHEKDGYQIKLYIASRTGILKTIDKYKHISLLDNLEELKFTLTGKDLEEFEKNLKDVIDLKNRISEIPTTEVINILMAGALKMEASDIHFEPQQDDIRLRYRLDGILQNITLLPSQVYHYILSRVKVLSGMKINIRDVAQDGQFTVKLGDTDVDVRVSVLPGNYGENIVMRLLNQQSVALKLDDLGLRGLAYDQLREQVKKPNGMILNTGPTGSGKTTTLYAIVNEINSPEIKIITIEDPIEYKVKGIAQTQVSRSQGYTFSSALRAIVRQDPDVILVGEIRDDETANVAIHASLTGHLVLSTLHTNSAVETVPRLVDMGVKPSLIPSSANALIAQRLVRRLCPHCRENYAPARETIESIKKILAVISPKAKLTIPKDIKKFYRAVGCPKCHGLGYKGRIGIFEVLTMTEAISEKIAKLAPESEILSVALEEGMVTMTQDGILKALEGLTSLEEVQRVTGESQFLEELYEKIITQLLMRSVAITKDDEKEIENVKNDTSILESRLRGSASEISLRYILGAAILLRAGDIHIEPEENSVVIRYRIDGILQNIASFPLSDYPQIIGSIKLLSGFKSADTEEGVKDSRFTVKIEEGVFPEITAREIDIRVSIILGGYGETVVLRLLNQAAQSLDISQLGIREENLKKLLHASKKPNGIILNTGPTGSGKTTTLYSLLAILNKPGVKIITVEDPIEYRLKGVLQTQVNEKAKYTFPIALRALLRQNPDIMMIGEVRDGETAKIAVQAALTGHLVLTTLHTNNAAGSVQRLINMEVSPSDIASAVNCFMAQRLMRMLCPKCKKRVAVDESVKNEIMNILSSISKKAGIKIPDESEITHVFEAHGCPDCNNLGYQGRTTVSEVMDITKGMEHLISKKPTTSEIEELAIGEGMLTMAQDGILKVIEGITTLEEVQRVTEE